MRIVTFGVIFAVLLATGASAALVTSSSGFPAGSLVINFSQFTGAAQIEGTNGPVQVGTLVAADVVFTSANTDGYLSNFDGWGLSPNGNWTSAHNGYASVNDNSNPMVFTFATPVAAVGGFMSYQPGDGTVTFEALGAGNVVLETYDLTSAAPISAPGTDGGAFRGIVRPSADIVALRIIGGYAVIDDLTFSASAGAAIPATSPLGLVALGLLLAACGVVALRWRA